ncbi:DUF4167 domain-containing protein [Paracoccus sp. S-4012]|uniref:DUF4167 domain-containing protein n=1 Tax=Paracoccus sp. S-4012 TaxID=2665648 RepID=UPI0012B06A20|nr:DUF4167 domain-containing protein [Paracoccus sp. S-4012]MRX51068.1 DUF4167 domain-containing protein [Paracoccus sp. S-4012]
MRSSKSRSRNKSNRQRPLGNVVNRVFDSSGPEGKVRGTPQQIIDKYLTLARDAQLSGDRVAEQSFLQHAEHYTRMLGEAMREQAERQQQQGGGQGPQQRDDDGGRDDDRQPRDDRAQRDDRQPRDDRRDDRQQRDERPQRDDRQQRDERPREDRQPRDDRRRDSDRRDDNRREDRGNGPADAGTPPWQAWAARGEGGLPDAVGGEDEGGPVELPEARAEVPAAEAAAGQPAPAADEARAEPAAPARQPRATTRPRAPRKTAAAADAPDETATSE